MSSIKHGWLDIHGHFRTPETLEEQKRIFQAAHKVLFLISKPYVWNVKDILSYLDRAGISMQMISNIPSTLSSLQASNDYGASIVEQYPSRFGLLAALPSNNPAACLAEVSRTTSGFSTPADGYAVTTNYNGTLLSDESLNPVWEELNYRQAVVFIHPNAFVAPTNGRPAPVIEALFDTTRTVIDMLYKGVFRRYTSIKFVLAHAGGCLPVLSGRLQLLGTQDWVPNEGKVTKEEIKEQLGRLYVDTAASAATGLEPAFKMVGMLNCIYGADCGVPCSTEDTMEENRLAVIDIEKKHGHSGVIGSNGFQLFPNAAKRAGVV